MKEFVKFEHDLGADAKVKAAIGVEGEYLELEASARYPLTKIVEPAAQLFDNMVDKLVQVIPGDWDKKFGEDAKREFREQLVKLLSEKKPELQVEPQAEVAATPAE